MHTLLLRSPLNPALSRTYFNNTNQLLREWDEEVCLFMNIDRNKKSRKLEKSQFSDRPARYYINIVVSFLLDYENWIFKQFLNTIYYEIKRFISR